MRKVKWLDHMSRELAALKARLTLGRPVCSGGARERGHLLADLTWSLRQQGKVVLIYIDLVQFHQMTQLRGLEWAVRMIAFIKKHLPGEVSRIFAQQKLVAAQHLWADDFVILLSDRDGPDVEYYWNMCYILRLRLKDAVSRAFGRTPGRELEMHIGFSIIDREDPLPVEILYYNALRQARLMAKGARQWRMVKLGEQFKEILAGEKIRTLYQPIVSLQDGSVIGWEALSRGDVQGELGRPDLFFQLAEEMGMLFQAEKICRNLAISRIGPLKTGQCIFLNVHPRTLADLLFVRGETFRLLQERGLKPENVVIEVTERHSMQGDGELARAIEHYRQQGYQVAIDDVGAGYAGLSSIALLRPDYLKIDMAVQRLLEHLNKNQLEFFKNANPLTGLPGNLVIENYLQLCARENKICTVIWADLDNFKAYNDNYGFAAGDRMIVLLSKILRHVVGKYGGSGGFVGHIGGDDFILVVENERAELLARKTIALFERLKKHLFHQEDLVKGGYVTRDRSQQITFCPLVTLSLAMADCLEGSCYENLPRLAVELKKYAKSLPGSVYVRNRRSCAVSSEKCPGQTIDSRQAFC